MTKLFLREFFTRNHFLRKGRNESHRDVPNVPDKDWLRGDVLVEPAVDQHVTDGGGHRDQVETEEGEVIEPAETNYSASLLLS